MRRKRKRADAAEVERPTPAPPPRPRRVVEPADTRPLLTLRQVADRLGVSTRTVEALIARRELRAIRIGHGRGVRRVTEGEVERLIAASADR